MKDKKSEQELDEIYDGIGKLLIKEFHSNKLRQSECVEFLFNMIINLKNFLSDKQDEVDFLLHLIEWSSKFSQSIASNVREMLDDEKKALQEKPELDGKLH